VPAQTQHKAHRGKSDALLEGSVPLRKRIESETKQTTAHPQEPTSGRGRPATTDDWRAGVDSSSAARAPDPRIVAPSHGIDNGFNQPDGAGRPSIGVWRRWPMGRAKSNLGYVPSGSTLAARRSA